MIDWYYINLSHRMDRQQHIESELNRVGITASRFNALTPSHRVNYPQFYFPPRYLIGGIGCFFSHYELIKNYTGSNILGILEDDIIFCDDYQERIELVYDFLDNNDWDIFYISAYFKKDRGYFWTKDYEEIGNEHIVQVFGSFHVHSYLVNPKSRERIVNLMELNLANSYAIDHLMILLQPQLKCYSFVPGMTRQIPSQSDNTGSHSDNHDYYVRICGDHIFKQRLC